AVSARRGDGSHTHPGDHWVENSVTRSRDPTSRPSELDPPLRLDALILIRMFDDMNVADEIGCGNEPIRSISTRDDHMLHRRAFRKHSQNLIGLQIRVAKNGVQLVEDHHVVTGVANEMCSLLPC